MVICFLHNRLSKTDFNYLSSRNIICLGGESWAKVGEPQLRAGEKNGARKSVEPACKLLIF